MVVTSARASPAWAGASPGLARRSPTSSKAGRSDNAGICLHACTFRFQQKSGFSGRPLLSRRREAQCSPRRESTAGIYTVRVDPARRFFAFLIFTAI